MMAPRGLALAIALALSACSVERPSVGSLVVSQHIIGGVPSEPSEFLATGMVTSRARLVCTATLIAPDVALTAAHCLIPPVFGNLSFTLDTDGSNGTDEMIPIRFTHQHPDFDERVDPFIDLAARNDVGVIILERPVLDVPVEQIDDPSFDTAIDPGGLLPMVGYGLPQWSSTGFGLKRDATVMVDRADLFEFATVPADPQPCLGDSGAPLFVESPSGRRIVGLVSRAMGRSEMCDTGAIITRVAPYAEWIGEASRDRSEGCNAGGTGSGLPLALWAAFALRARRRRATPR